MSPLLRFFRAGGHEDPFAMTASVCALPRSAPLCRRALHRYDAASNRRGAHMADDITQLISLAKSGDRAAADSLFTVVYAELRAIAGRQRRRVESSGMGATSLVHESYLRLIRGMSLGHDGRAHFFATAARAMRQIAIDRVRAMGSEKRGGRFDLSSLEEAPEVDAESGLPPVDLIALDQALTLLEGFDPRLATLVELRFFAGMSLQEAGEQIGVTDRTLKRDWRKARAFLHTQLGGTDSDAT